MKNHSLFTISTFARISIRRYFRDRVAMFFTIIFPLVFLAIFGGLGNGNRVSFKIAFLDQSNTAYAQKVDSQIRGAKVFNIDKTITSLEAAKQKMSRSEIDATVILPTGFGEAVNGVPSGKATVLYDENNASEAQALSSVLQGNFDQLNAQLVPIKPPFGVKLQSNKHQGLSRFDYTFSGLLGFSILSLGIFGPMNYFPEMKKQGILRRLHITPIRVWEYFLASAISNAVVGLVSISVMFVVAERFFHFHLVGNIFELAVLVVLGVICMFGIGLAVGGWAKNERQAAPVGNIVVMPMMFLSGTFFPRYLMPLWLQHITNYLPLTPIIDGIRFIATEGQHLSDIGAQLGLIALWTVIIYLIAFRVFRWE